MVSATLLQLMGHDSVLVDGLTRPDDTVPTHQWVETVINGKVYVVNFDGVLPREEFYENNPEYIKIAMLGMEGPCLPYDPDWYKKGIHV